MKIWIGGEIESSIEDDFRLSRSSVEKTINQAIETKSYDIEIDSWDCIVILRNDSDLVEVFDYCKSDKEMDFRLRIDYKDFISADHKKQESLVFELCVRSLYKLEEFIGKTVGLNELIKDVATIGESKGWLN